MASLEVRENIIVEIRGERIRQERKFGATQYEDNTAGDKLAILVEEVGEIARAMNDNEGADSLFDELVQTAAVCVAWAEAVAIGEG